MANKSAVFYCSSSFNIDSKYNAVAREVVRATALKGYSIVSGGTIKGTMKDVADAAESCGGINIGILPRFMAEYQHPGLSELIWTDTMAQRKTLMREYGADLAVALPGGIGTLDELFETYTLAKLGQYSGKVIAYNCYGFYDKLKDLMDFYVTSGMLDRKTRDLLYFPETLEEYEALI